MKTQTAAVAVLFVVSIGRAKDGLDRVAKGG